MCENCTRRELLGTATMSGLLLRPIESVVKRERRESFPPPCLPRSAFVRFSLADPRPLTEAGEFVRKKSPPCNNA